MKKPFNFVVYYVASTVEKARYARRYDADRLAAKLNARSPGIAAVASVADYNSKVVYMVERVNLMTGKKYMEPSNTPNYLSPASETYWST